ncbi:hypothetical protein [Ottowia sp.]|uniref:hypothetical protein n=1 Tax=Ottowia sp. TaxID=1898956 RepID=UPI00262C2C18|nr:hypothetical protein [Ottowia sp.]
MRGIWGLVGLVVTVAIVMLLVNKQLTSGTKATVEQLQKSTGVTAAETATVRQQSQQIQQQYKQALDAAMQPRPMPDDAK